MQSHVKFLQAVLLGGIFLLSLSGCVSSTAGSVRKMGPEYQFSFIAQENYQSVYRKILEQMRECYSGQIMSTRSTVQGDIFLDTKSGTIMGSTHNNISGGVHQVIDITALNEQKTSVVAYYSRGTVENRGLALKEWVLENSKECGPKGKQ